MTPTSKSLAFCLLNAAALLSASADDTDLLANLLSKPGNVTLPARDYQLNGERPIPLQSNTTIHAHGARFILPNTLPDKARIILFSGKDVAHFAWHGGEFVGHVFDPAQPQNTWEPNANTKGIEITTTSQNGTHDLLFRDVKANGMAGAVIGVHGVPDPSNESKVLHYAERISLENCTLLRSGKFMWDYGYLWQIVSFPESFHPWEVDRAKRYFRSDLLHDVTIASGDTHIAVNNQKQLIKVSRSDAPQEAITFQGNDLPQEIVRGRQYFVVHATATSIQIAETPNGPPLHFSRSGKGSLARDVFAHYLSAYAPSGSGPGKGAFDIVAARDVSISGCRLSALGDTMHIQRSQNILFANNHILGSRMGAFFLAEYCQNAVVTGNLVDGTNGSRVISVEKSCANVTLSGNTFRNGGRGAWINQPTNFVMTGNLFLNNTTKNSSDPRTGRIAYQTGSPGAFPELYFTLHETNGRYGPVLVRNNIFQLGEHCPKEAVTFAPNGHDILFEDNIFTPNPAVIVIDPSCSNTRIQNNSGATTERKPVDFNHGRR